MKTQSLKFTLKHGQHRKFLVYIYTEAPLWLKECSVCIHATTQNEMRQNLSILYNMGLGSSLFDGLYMAWHPDTKDYRLWVETRNFPGRAAYYAGMIHAYKRLTRTK
jgi:hypothetical protein